MAIAESRMNIRIDTHDKEEVSQILEKMGLDTSTAIRMFFKQIILQNGIPFEITNTSFREKEIEELKLNLARSRNEFQNGNFADLTDVRKKYADKKARIAENGL